ncbi:thioredoxin family protein [Roseimarinus sediminis]|uniref:thioredoxin family protein n=1 Tax=Roseimarinus sediminis TaxID=1610899 RepID=UPI003D25C17D
MDIQNLKPAGMEIKVLGTGCPKCKSLEKATLDAVSQTGIDATVSKVEDIVEIMNYGVMSTPALVVNGKVVLKGRVPSVDEIKSLISK